MEKIIAAYQNWKKSKARRRDSSSSENGRCTDNSTNSLTGSQLLAKIMLLHE